MRIGAVRGKWVIAEAEFNESGSNPSYLLAYV